MSNGTNALRAATQAQKEPRSFLELVDNMRPEIARALPRHMNADRMVRIATTEFRKNAKLGECEIRSTFGAIITLSQLGLEPGVMGQGYLVPYKNHRTSRLECQAIPGWQGLADLVARAGRASVWTGAVYLGDEFDWALGDRPHIHHRPSQDDASLDPKNLTHVYAVGRIKGAEWPVIEVWSTAKVEKHRNRFNKVGNAHYSYQHFEMYARKVVLLQVIKYMPKSIELQRAVELEEHGNAGQTIEMQQAANDSWVPPAQEDDQGAGGQADQGADAGGSGYQAQYADAAAAVAELKKANTIPQLDKAMDAIERDFQLSGRPVPVELEGAFKDRKEALQQKGS